MNEDAAREIVAQEMNYWRDWMLKEVHTNKILRNYLLNEEVIICAILANRSAALIGD